MTPSCYKSLTLLHLTWYILPLTRRSTPRYIFFHSRHVIFFVPSTERSSRPATAWRWAAWWDILSWSWSSWGCRRRSSGGRWPTWWAAAAWSPSPGCSATRWTGNRVNLVTLWFSLVMLDHNMRRCCACVRVCRIQGPYLEYFADHRLSEKRKVSKYFCT